MPGMSKAGNQYAVGRKGAKSLLTQSAKSSMAGAGMMYGGVLALLGELMFPKQAKAPSVKEWMEDDENAVRKDAYLTGNINTAGPAHVDIDQREDYARAKRGLPKRKRNRNY